MKRYALAAAVLLGLVSLQAVYFLEPGRLHTVACERKCAPEPGRASKVSAELRHAWEAAFDGDRPSDTDLQAYSDAVDILDCIAKEPDHE